jgi:hypothetical protein
MIVGITTANLQKNQKSKNQKSKIFSTIYCLLISFKNVLVTIFLQNLSKVLQ